MKTCCQLATEGNYEHSCGQSEWICKGCGNKSFEIKFTRTKINFIPIIKSWKLPPEVEQYLIALLGLSNTPTIFEDSVLELSDKLRVVRKLSESYHDNWHSTHCECNNCLEEEKGWVY